MEPVMANEATAVRALEVAGRTSKADGRASESAGNGMETKREIQERY